MRNRKSEDLNNLVGSSNFSAADCFNTTNTSVVLVDSQHRVIFLNPAADCLFGQGALFLHTGLTCHQLICGEEMPCSDCVLHSPSGGPKSHTVQDKSGQELFVREELLCFPEFNVLILLDVTREITALRNLDLTTKELKAKTILLERRRLVAADEKWRIQTMFDQLPDALIQVGDDYEIFNKNRSASKILPSESGETCYAMLGKENPCPECPANQGFQYAGGRKVIHRLNGRCLTEHVIQGSGEGGGLLLFSDTTRQVELIAKIREQQDTITRKNNLLSSLVGFQTRMQKAMVTNDTINYFLDVFLPLCHAESALVIIDDIRSGCVWHMVHRGIDESQAAPVIRSYLSREVQSSDSRKIPREYLPWEKTCQMELIGGNGQKVGAILFPASELAGESELIHLFLEPFGAVIHNRLLLRQLEEKANTDPLTGLFNRGYIEEALAVEKKKSDKFDIPYSVVVVDVNRLKQANDVYGHEVGDRLLLSVSQLLKSEIRATDVVARTGGDEFLILLTDTTEAGAWVLVDRFEKMVFKNVTMEVGENEKFPVTISLGAAGSNQVSHDDLIKTADKRMYEAKEQYYKSHERYR